VEAVEHERRPLISFDHFDPAMARDPLPVYKSLREKCPIGYTTAHDGFWVVSTFEDIDEITHLPNLFSNRFSGVPRQTGFDDAVIPPLNMDPPDHKLVKRILAGPFTPGIVEQRYRPITIDIVSALINRIESEPSCDAAHDFARLVPTKVICGILGVSEDLTDQFAEWIHRQLELPVSDPLNQAAGAEIFQYFAGEIQARKAQPTDDLISYLLTTQIEGRQLDESEVALACAEVLLAGIDTTWDMIAYALWHLARHPDQQEMLRANPDLMPTAREEFLRAFAPVALGRYVSEDVMFKGCDLKSGDMLWLALLSANHDPAAFDRPDEVLLDRQPNRHTTFGLGIHRCLGSNLARMELDVAIGEFLRRLRPFELDRTRPVEWSAGQIIGPRQVPLVFV
jgi:cytochrome P450